MKREDPPVWAEAKWTRQVEELLERFAIDIKLDGGDLLLTQEELERDLSYGRLV